jgi:hypothetical protein
MHEEILNYCRELSQTDLSCQPSAISYQHENKDLLNIKRKNAKFFTQKDSLTPAFIVLISPLT